MNPQSNPFNLLQQRYLRNADRPVAFVDESYLAPGFVEAQGQTGRQAVPFYVLTGVVVYPKFFDEIREDLVDIVGGNFFHATQYGSGGAHSDIPVQMAQYLIKGDEVALVSVRIPAIDNEREMSESRRICYRTLLKELNDGTHHNPVRLVVGEERREHSQNNWDRRILSEAKKDGLVDRNFNLILVSPAVERLLWLPDLVSNSMYRHLAGTDDTNYSILEPCIQVLTPNGRELKRSSP